MLLSNRRFQAVVPGALDTKLPFDMIPLSPLQPNSPFHNRRIQRSLSFAFFAAILCLLGLYHIYSWPEITELAELQHDTLTGLHKYTSVPEDGRPRLPFYDDSVRQSTEEPFFEVIEYEENEDDDEVEEEEETTAQMVERIIESVEVASVIREHPELQTMIPDIKTTLQQGLDRDKERLRKENEDLNGRVEGSAREEIRR